MTLMHPPYKDHQIRYMVGGRSAPPPLGARVMDSVGGLLEGGGSPLLPLWCGMWVLEAVGELCLRIS